MIESANLQELKISVDLYIVAVAVVDIDNLFGGLLGDAGLGRGSSIVDIPQPSAPPPPPSAAASAVALPPPPPPPPPIRPTYLPPYTHKDFILDRVRYSSLLSAHKSSAMWPRLQKQESPLSFHPSTTKE